MTKLILGWEEWAALPKLGLPAIKAKVDTGAKTSSLHAFAIEPFGPEDNRRVRFGVRPVPDRPDFVVWCSARLIGQREVISSNGERERRFVIETPLEIGGRSWPIEVTLTDRESMQYRMLIGRQALSEDTVVEPTRSFCQDPLSYEAYRDKLSKEPVTRSLRIGLLSKAPKAYSTQRLVEAGESRDHVVEVIDTSRCYMNITAGAPEIYYDGEKLPKYDAIIPRVGASLTFYGLAVVRQFEAMGTYCVNSSDAIACSRDKLFAHQLLARHHVAMPATAFAHSPGDTERIIELVGGAPLVMKLLESTQGNGVVLAENTKSAEGVIGAFKDLNANFLVQQFISEAAGTDLRCFVVGGKVVASMVRRGGDGEYRSNLHKGGSAEAAKISKEERALAIKAAKLLGLTVAGVDMLRSNEGPKVLEVNSTPGLEGIEGATEKDVAGAIIEMIERNARPAPPPRKALNGADKPKEAKAGTEAQDLAVDVETDTYEEEQPSLLDETHAPTQRRSA